MYAAKLVSEGTLTEDDVRAMIGGFNKRLDRGIRSRQKRICPIAPTGWTGAGPGFAIAPEGDRRGDSAVATEKLQMVGRALTTIPEGFHAHRTIARQLQAKAEMFETGEGFDWATAEALAFGTLLDEGYPVRLSGQDSSRGTFSQRHSALVDQENEDRYIPLNHIRDGQAEFEVIDTLLSEEAVVGFEYGYSTAEPKALVLWEATVRRFRQRRAGDDRPVHRIGRNEMAAHVRAGDASAAWL